MPLHTLDIARAHRMPWKNGGGETLELAIAPPGADLQHFDWRISSARVGTAGAFSCFAGIDRSLAVLDGTGLRLQREDGRIELLHGGGAVACFPGEEAISAELQDGPVSDLNVMTRRAAWRHRLAPLALHGQEQVVNDAEVMLLWCQQGAAIDCRTPDGAVQRLARGQGLLLEGERGLLELQAPQPALLYLAWLYRQA